MSGVFMSQLIIQNYSTSKGILFMHPWGKKIAPLLFSQ